jgi:hypothetical protein
MRRWRREKSVDECWWEVLVLDVGSAAVGVQMRVSIRRKSFRRKARRRRKNMHTHRRSPS